MTWGAFKWPAELSLQSLRGRLAALIGLAFLPAGVVAMQSGLSAVAERQSYLQQSLGAEEALVIGEVRQDLTQVLEMARSLAANADLFAAERSACSDILTQMASRFPDEALLTLIGADARVVCSNRRDMIGDVADGPLLRRVQNTGVAAIGIVRSPRFESQQIFAAVSPVQVSGERWYVGAARLVAPVMARADELSARRAAFSVLTDAEGRILARFGAQLDQSEEQALARVLEGGASTWSSSTFPLGDDWAVIAPLQPNSIYLLRGWRPEAGSWLQRGEFAFALLFPLMLWIAAVAAVWWAVEAFVARPLSTLEDLGRAYARGQTTTDEDTLLRGAPTEIASLRRTMAAMAKTLGGRELRLAEALREEQALLHEVHHRVKNNLQMMASILSIQSRLAADESEARGLLRANERVHILAIAHAHIYESGEVHDVALHDMALEVARTLVGSRGAQVRLKTELEPAQARADEAVAFAFLIGEAVSIAVDAVGGKPNTEVSLTLKPTADNGRLLRVVAYDADAASAPAPAAVRLIEAFARQLNATLNSREAALIEIVFPPAQSEAEKETVTSPQGT
jgi:two-component sensor histidine kinase